MNASSLSARRRRILTALGLVRYTLRPAFAAAPNQGSAQPRQATSTAQVVLRVAAPDAQTAPDVGPPAVIWTQVTAWVGYADNRIGWDSADAGAVRLPPVATWTTAEGKRGLWLALKAHVRRDR